MRLLILGSTGQSRGEELEALTSALLKKLGYTDIVKNKISVGGHEIDVTGKRTETRMAREITTRMICECKAYSDPVNTDHWMKFLGKLFTEMTPDENVHGVMIALSGVNGNVAGQYEAICKTRNNIELVTGERLLEVLTSKFNLRSLDSVTDAISQYTSRTPINIEIGYRQHEFVYVVTFHGGDFCLVPSNPKIPKQLLSECEEIVSQNLGGKAFNLDEEFAFNQFVVQVLRAIIVQMLQCGGSTNLSNVLSTLADYLKRPIAVDDRAMARALELLQEKCVVRCYGNEVQLPAVLEREPEQRATLLRELYGYGPISIVPRIRALDDLIDADLLAFVLNQHSLTSVDQATANELLQIIRWSPSALVAAVIPPNLTSDHESQVNPDDEDVRKFRIDVFRQELLDRLIRDYQLPLYHKYFRQNCNIHELQVTRTCKVKTDQDLSLTSQINERLRILESDETLGSKYLLIKVMDHVPEPWDQQE